MTAFSFSPFSVLVYSSVLREGSVYLLEKLWPLIRTAQPVTVNLIAVPMGCRGYLLQAH